jgi:hypothetical protein
MPSCTPFRGYPSSAPPFRGVSSNHPLCGWFEDFSRTERCHVHKWKQDNGKRSTSRAECMRVFGNIPPMVRTISAVFSPLRVL